MEVIGYDPYISIETAWTLSRHIKRTKNIDDIFSECDYITIHVPLSADTRGFINTKKLALMKPTATLLNFARGELVDTKAIITAVTKKTIANYVTDFAEESLLNHENIIVFPHVGASTQEAEVNCAIMAARTIRKFLLTGEITNSVNMPTVGNPLHTPHRITVFHNNVPNVIGRISAIVADENINIPELFNRSKGDFAYSIVDLEEKDISKVIKIKEKIANDRIRNHKYAKRVRLIER